MADDIKATSTIEIEADINKVWDALTDPEMVKQYLFGTSVFTDWEVGSPIIFTGEYKGKPYKDKGTILAIEAPRLLKYTYWSSMSGKEDVYDNYLHVQYNLEQKGDKTVLTIINEKIDSEASREHMEQNWAGVLGNIKKLLEK